MLTSTTGLGWSAFADHDDQPGVRHAELRDRFTSETKQTFAQPRSELILRLNGPREMRRSDLDRLRVLFRPDQSLVENDAFSTAGSAA